MVPGDRVPDDDRAARLAALRARRSGSEASPAPTVPPANDQPKVGAAPGEAAVFARPVEEAASSQPDGAQRPPVPTAAPPVMQTADLDAPVMIPDGPTGPTTSRRGVASTGARRSPNRTSRSRLLVGTISSAGFVATAAAMGPVFVETENPIAAGDGPSDETSTQDLAAAALPAETAPPAVEVIQNYVYVDEEGNPLSEAEVAALQTTPLPTQPANATEVDGAATEAPATDDAAPTSTAAPTAPAKSASPKPTAAPSAAPTTAPPAAATPTAAPATAAPTTATPTPTAAPTTAAPAPTAAPTTAAPATTAPPPPPTTQPPPPTTAPPKSGSSG